MNIKSKSDIINEYIYRWLMLKTLDDVSMVELLNQRGINRVAIYGCTRLCQIVLAEIYKKGIEVPFMIDKNAAGIDAEIPVYTLEEIDENKNGMIDAVIICIVGCDDSFIDMAKKYITVPIIFFEDIVYEL